VLPIVDGHKPAQDEMFDNAAKIVNNAISISMQPIPLRLEVTDTPDVIDEEFVIAQTRAYKTQRLRTRTSGR
jgi:hypothetical protein